MNFAPQDICGLRNSLDYWSQFLCRCISQRLDIESFRDIASLCHEKHPASPLFIADIFLRPQPVNDYRVDSQLPVYIQTLCRLDFIDPPSILETLYKHSTLHALLLQARQGEKVHGTPPHSPERPLLWRSSSWLEEFMFYYIIKTVADGDALENVRTALTVTRTMCKWMDLFASASAAFSADVLGRLIDQQARDEQDAARAAFVPLLLHLVETPSLVRAISKPHAKVFRKELTQSLTGFMPTLQHALGFVQRLEIFRRNVLDGLGPVDNDGPALVGLEGLLDQNIGSHNLTIPNLPIPATRAGLYIYLNAALTGRPIIDDGVLLSLLHNRYQGAVRAGAVDLVLASFDILANAVFRNEGPRDAHLLRSFLINKVPLLLRELLSSQFSVSPEFCITEALNRVDTRVFPTASLMFDESRSNNPYTESVREDFCTACALHGLVHRENVEQILGETSMSYEPSLEKQTKEKLVQDCLASPDKIRGLVQDLDKMDGNVGAVGQAVVELLRQLCNSKATSSLKRLCGQLAHKPQSLDVLLLYEKLPAILNPLCQLLDGWAYDDDQAEYQPAYDEFGAVLLLVMIFTYRYNLTATDIGLTLPDSCVVKILSKGHLSRRPEELTAKESEYVGGWIHGLFHNDTGGLGDDLMSSGLPQDFYFVVATIFQNAAVAHTYGYLTDESLKSGIEFVVDTFLLPSLIPAIRFLADFLRVEQKEQRSIIKILQLILLPSSISGEASAMLTTVKNAISQPLESSLRSYQRQDPRNQDIEPLLRAVADNLPFSRRTGGADQGELESWSTSSSTGVVGSVRHTIQALVQWMGGAMNAMPTSYTHRQVITACRMVGHSTLLRALLEEVRQQIEVGNASIAFDVVAAMICAPDTTEERVAPSGLMDVVTAGTPSAMLPTWTLRDELRSEAEDCAKLQKDDTTLAEIVVQLYRRVEAQMALPQPQSLLSAQLNLDGAPGELDNAIAVAAAAAGLPGDAMTVGGVGLDMGIGGISSDLGIGGPSGEGGLDPGGDGDLFGDIDPSMDMFSGWEGMDLGGS